jgi:hypothetical protein
MKLLQYENLKTLACMEPRNIIFSVIWYFDIVVAFVMTLLREQVYKYYHPNLLLVHPNTIYWNNLWYIMHHEHLHIVPMGCKPIRWRTTWMEGIHWCRIVSITMCTKTTNKNLILQACRTFCWFEIACFGRQFHEFPPSTTTTTHTMKALFIF